MLAARTTQGDGTLLVTTLREAERTAHLDILYRLTERLYRAAGLDTVLSVAMDAIIDGLGCEKCSILLFDAEGVMRFVGWRGLSDHYRKTLEGHTPWSRETADPPPIFVADIAATGESERVKSTTLAENIRSLAIIPLTAQGKVIGKFMIYHSEVRGCSEAEKALAITIARQLGFRIERERAQEQRELLVAELNHRVKNTLAVVQGLAYQTFRQTEALPRKAFDGRLLALARAHDLLTRSHWENTTLQQIAADTLQLSGADRQRISAEGPPVSLKPHAALTIALALHELFTNALKHGALSGNQGKVSFCWNHLPDEGTLRLEWREQDGPPVTPPGHRGFGSLLLERTLAQDLDGRVELSFAPTGVVCVIEMPLA